MEDFVAVAETHISTVFFAGERAFKLLKPVVMPFLDYSATSVRLDAIDRELDLNRRMAPDVYLGTADVVERGVVTDRFLVMRRMPTRLRLPELLKTTEWSDDLRKIARKVAQFHSVLPSEQNVAEIATRDAVRRNWRDNSDTINKFIGSVFRQRAVSEVEYLYESYLAGREHLFAQRIASGLIKDGHGDLTAEDIFCLEDGPRILDCLAFRDDLRIADVLCDIAFLAMDVERLGGPDQAAELMRAYGEFSNEHHPTSLAHFYIAYRAHVRAKVACLRMAQRSNEENKTAAVELARRYHDLCLSHLREAELRVILVGGGSGTGKTTLASGISSALGWITLSSDEIRKELTGHSHTDDCTAPYGEGIYTTEITERTYRTMVERASLLLKQGESVVLDATWSEQKERERIREAAILAGARLTELECALPLLAAQSRAKARMEASTPHSSDATPETIKLAFGERSAWPEAHPINTSESTKDVLSQVLRVLRV
jgi:aminoglycoside phosphotransferase family enzyme/predicted kinase